MQRLLEVAKYMYAAWSPKRPRHVEHKSPSVMSIVFHTQHLLHENSRELQMIILILLSLERISAAARGGPCCAIRKPRLCSQSVWLMETPAYARPCIPMCMSYWRRGRIHMRLKVVSKAQGRRHYQNKGTTQAGSWGGAHILVTPSSKGPTKCKATASADQFVWMNISNWNVPRLKHNIPLV
jgi:hypothetical protein